MAKIPQGILGGLRGRVGNVVGAAWKGINYIRSMPLSVANPNTPAQQAQRGAFTQCVATARLLLADLIATYWDPFARAMSGYNHFISINIDAFLTAGFDDPTLFFSARGILKRLYMGGSTSGEGAGTIVLNWIDNTGEGDALATDEIVAVWYNVTQEYWKFEAHATATRTDGTATMTDGDVAEDDVLETFTFAIRPDLEKISDSNNVQITVGA